MTVMTINLKDKARGEMFEFRVHNFLHILPGTNNANGGLYTVIFVIILS